MIVNLLRLQQLVREIVISNTLFFWKKHQKETNEMFGMLVSKNGIFKTVKSIQSAYY